MRMGLGVQYTIYDRHIYRVLCAVYVCLCLRGEMNKFWRQKTPNESLEEQKRSVNTLFVNRNGILRQMDGGPREIRYAFKVENAANELSHCQLTTTSMPDTYKQI